MNRGWIALILGVLVGCTSHPSPESKASAPTPSVASGGGTDVGNGGNGLEAQWKSIAADLEEDIRRLVVSQLPDSQLQKIKREFPSMRQRAALEFKDYPLLLESETANEDNPSHASFLAPIDCAQIGLDHPAGSERDAINFAPAPKIKISRKRVACYTQTEPLRLLILHEYLGLLGVNEQESGQTQYETSRVLLKDFQTIDRVPSNDTQVILVKTCEDFQNVGYPLVLPGEDFTQPDKQKFSFIPTRTWKLANDIDCHASKSWNNGEGFQTRDLLGHLDGNGYRVAGIYMRAHGLRMNSAIFQVVCNFCVISSLTLADAYIENHQAGLAYWNQGHISHVALTGHLVGHGLSLSGLVGSNSGIVSHARVRADFEMSESFRVHAFASFAGLVGDNSGQILFSEVVSEVRATALSRFGGVAASNSGLIADCTATTHARVNGALQAGGLVGNHEGRIERSAAYGSLELRHPEELRFGDIFRSVMRFKQTGIGGIAGVTSTYSLPRVAMIEGQRGEILDSKSEIKICGAETFQFEKEIWTETPQPILGRDVQTENAVHLSVEGTHDLRDTCVD